MEAIAITVIGLLALSLFLIGVIAYQEYKEQQFIRTKIKDGITDNQIKHIAKKLTKS